MYRHGQHLLLRCHVSVSLNPAVGVGQGLQPPLPELGWVMQLGTASRLAASCLGSKAHHALLQTATPSTYPGHLSHRGRGTDMTAATLALHEWYQCYAAYAPRRS